MGQREAYDNASFSVLKHDGQHGDLLLVEREILGFLETEVYRARDGSYLGKLKRHLNPEPKECRNLLRGSDGILIGWFCDDTVCIRLADRVKPIHIKPIDYIVKDSEPVSIEKQ